MRIGAGAFAVQQAGLLRLLLTDGAALAPCPPQPRAASWPGSRPWSWSATGEPDPVLTGYGLLLGSMSACP